MIMFITHALKDIKIDSTFSSQPMDINSYVKIKKVLMPDMGMT